MIQTNGSWNVEVKNFGSDGATAMYQGKDCKGSSCGYANPNFQHYANYPQSLQAEPDVVFIMLGTNDSRDGNWNEQGAASFVSGYTDLIRAYQALDQKPKIFLVKPPAMYDATMGLPGYTEASLNTNILPLVEQIARENQLTLLDANQVTRNMPSSFKDGIHPVAGSAACKAIAAVYFNALASYLKTAVSGDVPVSSSGLVSSHPVESRNSSVASTGKPMPNKPAESSTASGKPNVSKPMQGSADAAVPDSSLAVSSAVPGVQSEESTPPAFEQEESTVQSMVENQDFFAGAQVSSEAELPFTPVQPLVIFGGLLILTIGLTMILLLVRKKK